MAKYKIVGVPKKAKSSEYFELDLTPEEIEEYAKGGFIIEDISVPTLNHMQDGGQIYTYSGNPNASYEKVGDQWYISNKGTGNKFVPIQDPDGKRTAELNKNAVLLPGQPAPVEAPRPVQGAPRPVISRHVWEDATGTTYQNAIAEKKYLEGLKMSPKLADQELAKKIESQKAASIAAYENQMTQNMQHEQPLDMMDWLWGAAAALPVALPAMGEVAATSIYGSPLTYGNVGSLGFATHSALNTDNVVQDWKDVYAGKKDWRDAALNTGVTGLGFIGAGSGVKNLASTLSGERVVASAMPGFNTAKAFIEEEKLGDELANFKFNANALNKNAIVGTTPKQLPSSPNTEEIVDLWRIQERGAKPMAELAAEGKLGPMFQNEKAIQHFKDREEHFGQWFTNDKADLDWYAKDREFINPEIINLKVPKNELVNFQNYNKALSRATEREFVIPLSEQQKYLQLPGSPNALPILNLSSKISRDVDPGGKSLISFGDEPHPGGEYRNIDPEDYNIFNEQTGKLELDPNWKQEGLRDANESINSYLSKLPSYSSDATKGLGSYDFAEFSPGWEAMQEAKGLFMGPQKTVGPKDYYTNSEFYKLLEDQMKYDIAYGDAEYAAMLRNEKLDEKLFSELFPGLKQPDFRQKFLTTEQEKYVYNQLTQNPSVQSNPIGKQNLQKILEDNQKVQNALPSAAIKQELSESSAEDVIRYFGNEIGLKESDIPKLSPEQLESAKNKIINKLGQFYNNYAVNGNLKKPFSGNDALKGMIYSVDGPGDKMMDARLSEAMRHSFLPGSKSKNGQELLNDFYNRIQSPEGVRRLEALGINDPRAFRDLVIKELDNELAYYMEGPFIGEYIGLHKDMPERVAKKITRHELEHVVQKAYRRSTNKYGFSKLADDYLTDIDKELTKLTLRGTPSPKEEIRFEPVNWDPIDFPDIKDLFTNPQRNLDYFTYGSKGKEKAAFLAEVQQSMLEEGLIKDVYDKITVKDVEKAYNKYMEDPSPDKYRLRYFELIDPTDKKNFKITADQLNKMLTVTGIGLGVGLSSQGEEQGYAFGGSVRRSKLKKFIG